jgi:phosphotransacetylase
MAAKKIQELEMYKEMLKRRNDEIEERLAASGIRNVESTKIRIEVANPTSGVDPMIDVLKCLKSLGTKTRSIQSQFSDQELVAVMEIETKVFPPLVISCYFPTMVLLTGQILMQHITHGILGLVIITLVLSNK